MYLVPSLIFGPLLVNTPRCASRTDKQIYVSRQIEQNMTKLKISHLILNRCSSVVQNQEESIIEAGKNMCIHIYFFLYVILGNAYSLYMKET